MRLQPVGVGTATGRATAEFQSQVSLVRSGAPDAEPVVIDGHHTVELALAPDGWKICSIRHDQASQLCPPARTPDREDPGYGGRA